MSLAMFKVLILIILVLQDNTTVTAVTVPVTQP
jgi:hypothetical protein